MAEQQHGVLFPLGEDGRRSTTATGRSVVVDAIAAADASAARAAGEERDWRTGYLRHVVALTAAGARSADAALAVARAGLASAHDRMVWADDAGERPVLQVLAEGTAQPLATTTVQGEGEQVRELAVPYRGQVLRDDGLRRQLEAWVAAGTVEPSFAEAVGRVLDHPEWLDLRDTAFAVLGAGAEMGPLEAVAGFGATVLAVDVASPRIAERLVERARRGAGTVHLPQGSGDVPGADLLAQTPQVAEWLATTAPECPLTVGSYAYADGAAHVQVAVASDAVVAELLRRRPDVSYAELATPTDAFVVPHEVVEDARSRWAARGWRGPVQAPLRRLAGGRLYAPSYGTTVRTDDGREVGIADVLVPQQGPNYALAKRVQRWRATVSRAEGVLTSVNVAPATRTRSVTKNRLLAAAYAGAGRFGVEVFEPDTSRALMAALLVHDLREPTALARPDVPLRHPDDLFAQGAAHGGLWRVGYEPRSVLGLAAVAGARRLVRP